MEKNKQEQIIDIKPEDFKYLILKFRDPIEEHLVKEVIRFQIKRLKETHKDLFSQKKTKALVKFFFEIVYTDDFDLRERRDTTFLKAFESIKQYLSPSSVEKIVKLMELSNLTNMIDLIIANKVREIYNVSSTDFKLDKEKYEEAYRAADIYELRKQHIDKIIDTIRLVYNISRKPYIGFLLKPARIIAKSFKAEALIDMLIEGYKAALPLKNQEEVEEMIKIIYSREIAYLNYVYRK